MYLLCSCSLVAVYTAWTIAQARNRITGSAASGYAVIVMIFLYQPAYCIGYNALTYVYLVEIFPYYGKFLVARVNWRLRNAPMLII